MDKPVKLTITDPFWYLCDMAPGCLCSYTSSGNMPKYVIVPSASGGAVLDIWSDDPKEEKQTITFEPVEDGDDAMKDGVRRALRRGSFPVVGLP